MHMPSYLNLRTLEDELWKTVLEAVGSLEIDRACALSLQGWIAIGVQRMDRQLRLASEDVAIAHNNLKKLIELMKREAVFLGQTGPPRQCCLPCGSSETPAASLFDDVHALAVLAA